MNVIAHEMPFYNLGFLVSRQLVEYLPKLATQHTKNPLLPALRYKHHMIFAVPSRMAQALVFFHREFPFSWRRLEIRADRRKGQTLVSPPAEPGAYLYELHAHPQDREGLRLEIWSRAVRVILSEGAGPCVPAAKAATAKLRA